MTTRMGRIILQVVGFFASASLPATAWAQGNQFNPYGNSGYADYREFGNPGYANNPALPGQSRVDDTPPISKPRPNAYQQYADELDGSESDAGVTRRGSSTNMPYYMAYQQLNARYNRLYRPNASPADQKFADRSRQRDAAYAKALKEADPAKRAKLMREVDQLSLDRPKAAVRPKAAGGTTAPRTSGSAPIPPAPSPYATRSPSAPGTRRAPAPSTAKPGNAARRPAATTPATRAPAPNPAASISTTPAAGAARTAPTDPSSIPTPPPLR